MNPTTIRAALQGLAITAGPDGTPAREITALAAPYGIPTVDSGGVAFQLEAGSLPLDGPAPKVYLHHDNRQAVGVVSERLSSADGVIVAMKISKTTLGDEALTLAADGVLDAVSVGLEVTDGEYNADGTLVVKAARWLEVSLVPYGAFSDARVLSVAASTPEPSPEEDPAQPEPTSEEDAMPTDTPAVEATVPTAPVFIGASPKRLSPAEYIAAMASGHTAKIEAALAEMGVADTPGILPEPLVGDVFNTLNDRRPLLAAVGTLAMPRGGEIFNRRKVTQHTVVGEQAAEFDELDSQKMTVSKIPVTKRTYGGALTMSEQEIDWTDPAAVSLVLTDLGRVYAKNTESVAATDLEAAITETLEIADWTDGDEILDTLYDASAIIDGVIDELPTHVFLTPQKWATLGKAKAANGDRIFPALGPSNAAGTMTPGSFSIAGLNLRFVVSKWLPADSFIVGNPVGVEFYEQYKGAIRLDRPTTLSVELAVRGYFATCVIEEGAFVKFVDPA